MFDAPAADARRVITSSASAAAQRALKLRIEGVRAGNGKDNSQPSQSNNPGGGIPASARQRAANDPMVQRLQEKFGAEIRTVIDHREKKN